MGLVEISMYMKHDAVVHEPGKKTAIVRSSHKTALLPTLLCIAIFFGFFYNLNGFPLFDLDEGAFSEATREMLERSDFVTTYLNGKPRFDKPILIYWLQAVPVSLFGISEFAFRLPSAIASLAWMLAILHFTRQQSHSRTGFAAALIGATSAGTCVIGRAAIADALLNMFLVLSMFDIYRYLQDQRPAYRYRAFLWIGLGMLTKGPIALLIPGAVSAIVFALQGKSRAWYKAVLDPAGWAILLLVAGPWYLLEYQRQGQAFIDGFLMRHNIERIQAPLQGHSGSILYYLPVVLLLVFPYTSLFLRILPTLRTMRQAPLPCFLWTWFLFVLVFFSLSGTKLPHYLLYGISPLFILMALHRNMLRSRWLSLAPAIILIECVLVLPFLLQVASARTGNAYFREMLAQPVFGTTYYFATLVLLLAVVGLAFIHNITPWLSLVLAGLLCSIAIGGLVLPAIGTLQQAPVKEAALLAREIGLPVSTLGINMPSFNVYLRATTRPWKPGEPGLVLTRADSLSRLSEAEILYRRGGIILARSMP
jgi:4-amino-4-deoxy-L-arabinose transferase-like glycosyltransferase